MIIPYYKRYGQSSHLLAQQVGKLRGEKATHTGTLDPAAEGVLIVLTGEDRYLKQELAHTTKVYEAEVLWGISTDTHDLIGFPTEYKINSTIDIDVLEEQLDKLTGTYFQTQPEFSAKRKDGSSYFELAKQGVALPPSKNQITVEKISIVSSSTVSLDQLKEFQSSRLRQITGNFRQSEIEKKWHDVNKSETVKFPLLKLQVICSKRTYIRALVRDLAELLGIPAVLYSLVRTQNGPYATQDCLCLVPPSISVADALEV
jgi:tRNA pseudouridine55 synthase